MTQLEVEIKDSGFTYYKVISKKQRVKEASKYFFYAYKINKPISYKASKTTSVIAIFTFSPAIEESQTFLGFRLLSPTYWGKVQLHHIYLMNHQFFMLQTFIFGANIVFKYKSKN